MAGPACAYLSAQGDQPHSPDLLASPLQRAVSAGLMLLHVKGRKSGRVYVVPVGRHVCEGQLVASAGGAWRRYVVGGADLEVTLEGRRRPAYGELIDDPGAVAETFEALKRMGPRRASRLGLRTERPSDADNRPNCGRHWSTATSCACLCAILAEPAGR